MNDPKSGIAQVSAEAWREATKLATSVGKYPPPIPLEMLARTLSIERLVFEPLISDAGLAKHKQNFQIVINTEAENVPNLAGDDVWRTDSQWPALNASLRFSIAHEIAHLIFLKAAHSDQQNALFYKNAQAVENGCNILARMLLLPREMLVRSLEHDCLNPSQLIELCDTCRVSPEVLIRRFHLSDVSDHFSSAEGFVAIIQQSPNGPYVKACHLFGVLARDRFHRAVPPQSGTSRGSTRYRSLSEDYIQPHWRMEGCLLDQLQIPDLATKEPGTASRQETELTISWDGDKVIPCSLRSKSIRGNASYFLTLKILGPVQDPDQRVLF